VEKRSQLSGFFVKIANSIKKDDEMKNNMIEHAEVAVRLFKSEGTDVDKARWKENLQRYHRLLLKTGADRAVPVVTEIEKIVETLG